MGGLPAMVLLQPELRYQLEALRLGAIMPLLQEFGVNMFISSGDHVNEHWERRSWGLSLIRLMELYGHDFSAEIIHEYYTSLKVTVKKRSRP